MAKAKKAEKEEPLEKKLWKAADKLRKNMDAAEYKHVVLGLIFLKYISDACKGLAEQGNFTNESCLTIFQAKDVFFRVGCHIIHPTLLLCHFRQVKNGVLTL